MDFHSQYFKMFMRTAVIIYSIIFSLTGTLLAHPTMGQLLSKKVSIDNGSNKLSDLLTELENKNIPLVYDANEINLKNSKIRSKTYQNQTLKSVLDFSLKGSRIGYKEVNGYILLEKVAVQQPGRLSGKIIDERGNPLAQASIRLLGTNHVTQSSVDGSYSFSLAAGTYNLQVSYVSHQTQQISHIQIKAGELTRLNVSMKESSSAIEAVTVKTTFKKASVAGLYATQKNAATVTDGISAEQIARTPDNDMGQVLKRVTGLTTVDNRSVVVRGMSDRYNQAQLDGVSLPSTSQSRRDFAFDIIPTEMVSSVVVNKTATPDMSSEFSGGQVSINTLDIPEKNFTTIQVGTGSNSQTLGKDFYRLGERHNSEYFGFESKSAKMPEGIQVWSIQPEASSIDAIPLGENTNPEIKDLPLQNQFPNGLKYSDLDAVAQSKKLNPDALKFYKYKGNLNQNIRLALGRVYDLENNMKFGFSASGNFRNEQNIVQFNNVRGALSGFNYMDSTGFALNGAGTSYKFNSSMGLVANLGLQGGKFKVSLKNMYAKTFADNYNEAIRATYEDFRYGPVKEQYQLPEGVSLQQHQLVGEYQLPWNIKVDGMFTINKIKQQILDERRFRYTITTSIDGVNYFQSPNLFNPASLVNAVLSNDSRMWTHIDETDYNWGLNFTKNFKSNDFLSTVLKLGYQGVQKDRSLDVLRMLPAHASFDKTMPGEKLPAPEIMSTYDQVLSLDNIGFDNYKAYYYAENTGGRVSDGKMNSHAAYLMFDQRFWNRLRLVYGARLEFFDLNNQQENQITKQWGADALDNPYYSYMKAITHNQTRILPSINATYNITDKLNFRASYSQTAIRPDFRETGLFAFYSYELDGYISGDQVQTTIVDNTDLRLEWYPSPGEIVSITGYYKYLDKPIELIQYQVNSKYYKYANMESATNLGLEMEVRKNLSFIADQAWLSDFFVSANGTLLKSNVKVLSAYDYKLVDGNESAERVQLRQEGQDRPLLGQSPWLINLGLGYWGEKFGITASYNHRGYRTNLTAINLYNVEFELAPRQLDFQLYGRFLKKKMEVKFNLANLLNDWTRYYRNELLLSEKEIKDLQKEGKKSSSIGNVKYNKNDKGDVILYQRRDGRRYGLSVSYNF